MRGLKKLKTITVVEAHDECKGLILPKIVYYSYRNVWDENRGTMKMKEKEIMVEALHAEVYSRCSIDCMNAL